MEPLNQYTIHWSVTQPNIRDRLTTSVQASLTRKRRRQLQTIQIRLERRQPRIVAWSEDQDFALHNEEDFDFALHNEDFDFALHISPSHYTTGPCSAGIPSGTWNEIWMVPLLIVQISTRSLEQKPIDPRLFIHANVYCKIILVTSDRTSAT